MEATLKKQRHQGALIITGPLVPLWLTYLSELSGCRVTRTKDAKFAPQRTIQEKNAFIKSMLQTYADGQSFQRWCSVLHEFVKEEALLRLKLHLSVQESIEEHKKKLKQMPKHRQQQSTQRLVLPSGSSTALSMSATMSSTLRTLSGMVSGMVVCPSSCLFGPLFFLGS